MSAISGSTRLAAVIGDPVRHSLSPTIHNAGFAALDLDWAYVALPVAAGSGQAAVTAMRTLGIGGMSVTMPHKDEVAAAVDVRTPAVEALGACNCVYWDDNQLVGDNTDGDGFVASLAAEDVAIAGRSLAVLGAGGAARAIIEASARAGASRVVVINRSNERAKLAAGVCDRAVVGTEADLATVDLIVNATSVGMGADAASTDPDDLPLDPALLHGQHVVVDIVYQPLVTPLMTHAQQKGLQTVGGLGMLIHQAALAFERWTGASAPIDVMTEAAGRQLS